METTKRVLDVDGPHRPRRRPLGLAWWLATGASALLFLAALSGHPFNLR
ncbi:hypothetical protein [Aquabacterium olei]|nr:hypothetical protein [Aquabacterium olei]